MQAAVLAVLSVLAVPVRAAEARLEVVGTAPSRDRGDYARLGPVARSLLELPAAVTVLTRERLDGLGARKASEALAADPAAAENYAPLGYYEGFSLRGFTLDPASAFKRDGLTVSNEAVMPLENKESVEILKGAAGVESGLSAPGGVVDHRTRRPGAAWSRSVTLEGDGTGSRYAAVGAGGPLGSYTGIRFDAATETMRPYVTGAVGERRFASLTLERRLAERLSGAVWADWDRRSQFSVPAHQLLGGVVAPPGARPETMLNAQPWRRPVAIEASNVGLRLEAPTRARGTVLLAVNRNRVLSDDNASFPYGCSSGGPATAFCADGTYDVYDYRSPGEVRETVHARASWHGFARARGSVHRPAAALERLTRSVNRGQEVFEFVGTARLGAAQPAFSPSPKQPGRAYRVQGYSESALSLQDSVSLGPWRLHAGTRLAAVEDGRASKTDGSPLPGTRGTFLLPRVSLGWSEGRLALYLSHSQGLELGGTAPAAAANSGTILPPRRSTQYEAGARAALAGRLSAAVTAFRLERPLEFTDAANVFVRRGRAVHRGVEASASLRGDGSRLDAAAMFLDARQEGTGTASLDGRRPVNVPATALRASGSTALGRGLSLETAWTFTGDKTARRDGAAGIPAWHRWDAGLRWTRGVLAAHIRVENVLERVYWKDAGEAFGDGYLNLGAPRVVRAGLEARF